MFAISLGGGGIFGINNGNTTGGRKGFRGQGAEEDNLGPRGRDTSRHFWA